MQHSLAAPQPRVGRLQRAGQHAPPSRRRPAAARAASLAGGVGQKTNVLVVGSGGREHALAWRLAQSAACGTLYVAPGNAGTALEPNMVTLPSLNPSNHKQARPRGFGWGEVDGVWVGRGLGVDVGGRRHAARRTTPHSPPPHTRSPTPPTLCQIIDFCGEKRVGFVMVGPEQPLVEGLVDSLTAAGVLAFGPTAAAARLEGSKEFMKGVVHKYGIPTAAYEAFTDPEAAKAFIRRTGAPIVVKTSGLAAGEPLPLPASPPPARPAPLLAHPRADSPGTCSPTHPPPQARA